MTKFFSSKNSNCDIDLDPEILKRELRGGNVISNACMKLYRNWLVKEVARAMTKDEHTYKHTYVWHRPYILSTTLSCEGIISLEEATVDLWV